jgi:hypothetical protein
MLFFCQIFFFKIFTFNPTKISSLSLSGGKSFSFSTENRKAKNEKESKILKTKPIKQNYASIKRTIMIGLELEVRMHIMSSTFLNVNHNKKHFHAFERCSSSINFNTTGSY